MDIRTWQDDDENSPRTRGQWFAREVSDGHVMRIVGPFATEAEARRALGDED